VCTLLTELCCLKIDVVLKLCQNSLSDFAQLRGARFAAALLHLGGLVTMSGAYEKMRTVICEDMKTCEQRSI